VQASGVDGAFARQPLSWATVSNSLRQRTAEEAFGCATTRQRQICVHTGVRGLESNSAFQPDDNNKIGVGGLRLALTWPWKALKGLGIGSADPVP
jgi:hypothetical protein